MCCVCIKFVLNNYWNFWEVFQNINPMEIAKASKIHDLYIFKVIQQILANEPFDVSDFGIR